MESKKVSTIPNSVKPYRIINSTCFIGCYGKEVDLEGCVCRVQGDPYSFDEVNVDLITAKTEIICFSTNAGCWGRAEVLECLGSMQYRVRMTDFLEDEGGTPIFDVVSWNNMRAIPPKITAAMIPSLGGVFFLRDPDDVSTCCHVVDEVRMKSLIEELIDSNDLYKCVIQKPISPQASVVNIYLHLPLVGFPNGKLMIPYLRDETAAAARSVGPSSPRRSISPAPGVNLDHLRDLILYGAVLDARVSALNLLESVIRAQERGISIPPDLLCIRAFASPEPAASNGGLEDIEDDEPSLLRPPTDFLVAESCSSSAAASLPCASLPEAGTPYRKEQWTDESPVRPGKKRGKRKPKHVQSGDHLFDYNASSSSSSQSLSPCKRCGICGTRGCQCRLEGLGRKQ